MTGLQLPKADEMNEKLSPNAIYVNLIEINLVIQRSIQTNIGHPRQ